jgi:hypothetical protein
METKRCQRCHRLLRIDAKVCSLCGGQDFIPVQATKSRKTVKLALSRDEAAFPSNPPASPHRAGHYSGLHPEDQPYQSSFLPVQRPSGAAPAAVVEEEEPEALILPTRENSYAAMEEPFEQPESQRRVATFTPSPEPGQQRSLQTYAAAPTDVLADVLDSPEPPASPDDVLADIPTSMEVIMPPAREPAPFAIQPARRGGEHRGGIIPVLLVLSCLLFLIATSILAFLLVNNKPVSVQGPKMIVESSKPPRVGDIIDIIGKGFPGNDLLYFTRDENVPVMDQSNKQLEVTTYPSGNFSVEIMITKDWSVGEHYIFATDHQNRSVSVEVSIAPTPTTPPQLQLSASFINAGPGNPGAITQEQLMLINVGGGQVHWAAAPDAGSSWLSTSPQSGIFSGSEQIEVIINRGTLAPGNYSGHLNFVQQASNGLRSLTLTLPVKMAVKAAPQQSSQSPPNLVLSTALLAFSGTPASIPAGQSLVLQNTGGQVLNWSVTATTSDGSNWLAVTPAAGSLAFGQQEIVTVSVSTSGLNAGTTYTGSLVFTYGASSASVAVTLVVSQQPQPGLAVEVPAGGLVFKTLQGQNPPAQSFTISNPGTATLDWGITEDANGTAYAKVSQTGGKLGPGNSIAITVTPSLAQLTASTVNAMITVSDTDPGSAVKSQQVPVTFVIISQAQISLSTNQLTFNHDVNITNSTQWVIITNTGSATLNWALKISNNSQVQWLTVDTTSGSLEPATTTFVDVTCNSSNLPSGTYTATIQFYDTDAGTSVQPQTVTVTLVVS